MKKQLLLVLTFAISAISVSNAQSASASILFKHHNTLSTPDVALNSSSLSHPGHIEVYHYHDFKLSSDGTLATWKPYKHAKEIRNTGIGLTAAGGSLMVIGSALIADGVTKFDKRGFNSGDISTIGRLYEIYFGSGFTAIGVTLTIPGVIMLVKGLRKMTKVESQWADEHKK